MDRSRDNGTGRRTRSRGVATPAVPPGLRRCGVLALALALTGPSLAAAAAGRAEDRPALAIPDVSRALLLDLTRAGTRIVAAGAHGVIVTSDDGGTNWTQATVPASGMLTCVAFADERRGWAAGHLGVILASQDGGRTWSRVAAETGEDDSFLDLAVLPGDRILAVGAYGLYLASDDGGATWARGSATGEDLHLNRVTVGASGTVHLAGESGTLARSTDGGATWERLESPYEGSFFGLLELASGRLLAHGLRGHVYTSDDRGATWARAEIEMTGLVATAAEPVPGTIVVSGAGGQLYLSRDGGATFAAGPATGLTATAEVLAAGGHIVCAGDTGVHTVALPGP